MYHEKNKHKIGKKLEDTKYKSLLFCSEIRRCVLFLCKLHRNDLWDLGTMLMPQKRQGEIKNFAWLFIENP